MSGAANRAKAYIFIYIDIENLLGFFFSFKAAALVSIHFHFRSSVTVVSV